jgi:hypothetical protein
MIQFYAPGGDRQLAFGVGVISSALRGMPVLRQSKTISMIHIIGERLAW